MLVSEIVCSGWAGSWSSCVADNDVHGRLDNIERAAPNFVVHSSDILTEHPKAG
jgi:hypothetical protein